MFNKSISSIRTWLDIDDSVENRKHFGYEFDIGQQAQKKIEIKMKKPDAWNYQGKVRLLRIEKKEDRGTIKNAVDILATLDYNCTENRTLKEAEEGRAVEDLKILMNRYDTAISRGWLSSLNLIESEISEFINDLERKLTPPDGENHITLMDPLPEKYDRKKSTFETVKKGATIFETRKTVGGKDHQVKWGTVYHYELMHPKRKQPKTFATIQDIFASAEHTLYDQTQKGRKAKTKLYNVFAAFLWTILTATTEIVTITGGQVMSSSGFSTWMIAVGEAVFFAFLLYIIVRAIMSGVPVFTIELKPITYSPSAEGPIPAIVDDEKLLDTLLEMADASKDNIIDIGETLYSFQEGVIAEQRSEINQLKAEKNVLEQRMKESQEDGDYSKDTGRVRFRKTVPRWAYVSLIVSVASVSLLAFIIAVTGV